jgi:predicted RNA-binding protein YlxR (DUF448 family)
MLTADPAARLPGRGAYVCRTSACFERARTRGGFARTLRRTVRIDEALPAAPATEENVHLEVR